MNPVQASQTASEFASIDMKTSSRCSTFTSSEMIHWVSLKLGLVGINSDQQSAKVVILGPAEEWG
jgi:hypothetical protein